MFIALVYRQNQIREWAGANFLAQVVNMSLRIWASGELAAIEGA